MDREKTAYYLKSLHNILNLPIFYGVLGGSMQHFQPFSLQTNENELDFVINRLHRVFAKFPLDHAMYYVHTSLVMLGIVVNHDTGEFVFIGPVASSSTTEKDISDYLFETGLSADTTKQMAAYMTANKPLNLLSLQELLVNVDLILNDEILSKKELIAIYDSDAKDKMTFAQKAFNRENYDSEKQNTVQVEEYETKLTYCVMNGDLEGLSELLNNMAEIPFAEATAGKNIKELKMIALGSVFAAETTALKSGVPGADLDRTKQYYLGRIDSCKDPDSIHQLTISALYDFTKHAKDNLASKTENPVVNRAINYIKTNINSKLLAEDIANALHVNLHYLFTKFKQETGQTLTQFINREKIKKACYYLVFTDKTLIEIAFHLSFSSQAYFQSVFKKIMNQTPTDWRMNNTYVR